VAMTKLKWAAACVILPKNVMNEELKIPINLGLTAL
jgi:hypothetical protein